MATLPSQPTIYELSDAQYGLFYWIHLEGGCCHMWLETNPDDTTVRGLTTKLARIHQTSQRVNDPTGLKVGIGFGKRYLERILKLTNLKKYEHDTAKQTEAKKAIQKEFQEVVLQLNYKDRVVENHRDFKLPATDGDVFIHAKGNSVGTLYEFLHLFLDSLNDYRVEIEKEKTSVTLGFAYQHHRDISGYIYGIANPVTTDERRNATVMFNTGASFALTQKWQHHMAGFRMINPHHETIDKQNRLIGIQRENGKLLSPIEMDARSHVALMKRAQGKQRIVRQSLPYVKENCDTGLFFLAYANNTSVFGDMLDEMVAEEGDLLFQMSANTSGAYWYFPGMTDLNNLYEATRYSVL